MKIDTSVITELNLEKMESAQLAPFFTGWKNSRIDPITFEPIEGVREECVGQLIQFLSDERGKITRAAYVNLPGMESGVFISGSVMDIGDERLTVCPSADDMRKMLIAGLERLKEVVANDSVQIPITSPV